MSEISDEDKDFYQRLGARLKLQRERARISVSSLQDRTGVSESTILRIESGAEGTSISALLRLCSALGLRGPLDSLAAKKAIEPCTPETLEGEAATALVRTVCEEVEGLISEFCSVHSPYHKNPESLARDYMTYLRPFVANMLAGRLPAGTNTSIPIEPLVYSEDTVSRYYSKHTPPAIRDVHGWSVKVDGQSDYLCAEKLRFVPTSKLLDVFSTPDAAYKALQEALPRQRGLPVDALVITPLQLIPDSDDGEPIWRETTEGELAELYAYFPARKSYHLGPETE